MVEELQRRLVGLEHKASQSSKNSSLAPSSDGPKERAEATKTRADRRAAQKAEYKDRVPRRRGKQPGALGANLPMRAVPDDIINHEPQSCDSCGDDLSGVESESAFERRQVNDTPQPIVICTEHRAFSKRNDMSRLITEMIKATHEARDWGLAKLPRRQLNDFSKRYDANVEAGLAVNPTPVGRDRDTVERKGNGGRPLAGKALDRFLPWTPKGADHERFKAPPAGPAP